MDEEAKEASRLGSSHMELEFEEEKQQQLEQVEKVFALKEEPVKHIIKKKQKHSENMNIRAALVHLLGDMVQSIGVVTASIIIYL